MHLLTKNSYPFLFPLHFSSTSIKVDEFDLSSKLSSNQ